MFDYSKIVEVNSGITYTDVRGKNYAEVAQRVQAFRKLIPGGYITTDLLSVENGVCFMKAEAGYYDETGRRVMLATGLAFERQDASKINNTSFIENCETSAIGRALGFIGLGSEKSIASAEEVSNAIDTQDAIAKGEIPANMPRQSAPATVTKTNRVPQPNPPENPPETPQNGTQEEPQKNPLTVMDYLSKERSDLAIARKLDAAANTELWNKQLAVLREKKIISDKKLSAYTMKEAQDLVNYMYSLFDTTGTELRNIDGEIA